MFALLCLAGCHSAPPPKPEPLVARFYLEVPSGASGVPIQLPGSGVTIAIQEKPVFTEYDLRNAEVAQVELGRCLLLELTPAAVRDLSRLAMAQPGQRLVLFLNGAPVGARRLDPEIATGMILIFLETPEAELAEQVARLKRTTAEIRATSSKK